MRELAGEEAFGGKRGEGKCPIALEEGIDHVVVRVYEELALTELSLVVDQLVAVEIVGNGTLHANADSPQIISKDSSDLKVTLMSNTTSAVYFALGHINTDPPSISKDVIVRLLNMCWKKF